MVRALDFGNQSLGVRIHPGVTFLNMMQASLQLAVSSLLGCILLVVAYVLCESASRPFLVEHW